MRRAGPFFPGALWSDRPLSDRPSSELSRPRAFLGVAMVSASVLMLQLTLTRLFSATLYYHFAFLAISLALLGSGASGLFVYFLRARFERAGFWLSVFALLFALSTALALLVILASPLSPRDSGGATVLRLCRIYAASALPFFFAGCAVTLAVTRFARHMSRLYLFDLSGAAAGCLLLIPLLNALGAVNAVLLVAVLAAAAAVVFTMAGTAPRAWRRCVIAAPVALAALVAWSAASKRLDVRSAKGLPEADNVIFSRWNSFSRVTVWGSLRDEHVLVMIDADAATELSRQGSDIARHARLAGRVESLAYTLKPRARVLVLGAGGGNEVIMARLFGAQEITAVEVNPIIARDVMSKEPFRSYSGALYEQPGVRLVVDEGRSFVRSSRATYDVIQGTMVDTWAASAAGAFSLTENNLYTVEAFHDYVEHLAPDGILSLTRWHLEPPDQVLRLVSLARAMMAERRVADPARHLIVVRGPFEPNADRAPATLLFKASPFTDEEVRTVEAVAARYGFVLLYTPLTRPANVFTRLVEADEPEAVWRSLASDVSPPRDNDPFFFQTLRPRHLWRALEAAGEWRKTNLGTFVLFVLLAISVLVTIAFILGPLALSRRRLSRDGAPPVRWVLFFASLGAGFVLVEVTLVQKFLLFLGYPVYALAVVLFSLLVFSGVGARLSGRVPEERLVSALGRALVIVTVVILAATAALSPLFQALAHLDRPWRIAVAVALLTPLGLAMGAPMPTAIRFLAAREPGIIPWAWGVNGAASVMGSVAALAIALLAGFDQALLVGAGLYLAALLLVRSA